MGMEESGETTDDSAEDEGEGEDNYGSIGDVDNNNSEEIRRTIVGSLDAPDEGVRDAAQRILTTVTEGTNNAIVATGNDSDDDEESQPDEETSLLGSSNNGNDKMLRPSIFTSM